MYNEGTKVHTLTLMHVLSYYVACGMHIYAYKMAQTSRGEMNGGLAKTQLVYNSMFALYHCMGCVYSLAGDYTYARTENTHRRPARDSHVSRPFFAGEGKEHLSTPLCTGACTVLKTR